MSLNLAVCIQKLLLHHVATSVPTCWFLSGDSALSLRPHSADYWPVQAACIHQSKAGQSIKCTQCRVNWDAIILRITMHLQCPGALPESQNMTALSNPIRLARHCHFHFVVEAIELGAPYLVDHMHSCSYLPFSTP